MKRPASRWRGGGGGVGTCSVSWQRGGGGGGRPQPSSAATLVASIPASAAPGIGAAIDRAADRRSGGGNGWEGRGTPSAGCGSWRQPQCLQPLAQCLALGVAQRGLAQRAKRRAGICAAAQFARGAQQAIEAAAAARMRIAVAFDQT